jgi:hypothetical protein
MVVVHGPATPDGIGGQVGAVPPLLEVPTVALPPPVVPLVMPPPVELVAPVLPVVVPVVASADEPVVSFEPRWATCSEQPVEPIQAVAAKRRQQRNGMRAHTK